MVRRIIGDYVYEGQDDHSRAIIVKVCEKLGDLHPDNQIHPLSTRTGQLKNEISILTGPLKGCPGVPECHGYNLENHIVAVEPYLGLPLSMYPFPEGDDRDSVLFGLGEQVSTILREIHHKGVMHRDVKPDNIVIADDGTVSIIDFGMSILAKNRMSQESSCPAGTPAYGSDNFHAGKPHHPHDDFQSLGFSLHALRIGEERWFEQCQMHSQKGQRLRFDEICCQDPVVKKLVSNVFPLAQSGSGLALVGAAVASLILIAVVV